MDSVHRSATSQPETEPSKRTGVVGGVTSSGLGAVVVAVTEVLPGDWLPAKSRARTVKV